MAYDVAASADIRNVMDGVQVPRLPFQIHMSVHSATRQLSRNRSRGTFRSRLFNLAEMLARLFIIIDPNKKDIPGIRFQFCGIIFLY